MTSKKQLKTKIRARMAKTGERYSTARAHVAGPTAPVTDHGWVLRGGVNPDSAGTVAMLARAGVRAEVELDEPLVFVISGGIGAGYILWEFKHDDSRIVTIGFINGWQRIGVTTRNVGERLGVTVVEESGGAKAGTARLTEHLADGRAVMVWPDRFHIGYWHLPASLDGHGGHPVVAYAVTGDQVRIDDRNHTPLTVSAADLERSRARVGSYKNLALTIADRDVTVSGDRLRAAVRAGLADVVTHLSGSSDSFSLPAWRKWSRMMTDPRNAKAWPKVFADRRGLLGAMASVWEEVEPAGMSGGNHRALFADGLDRASALLEVPGLAEAAVRWREIALLWHGLAEIALPIEVPVVARLRELTAEISTSEGNDGAADRSAAAAELWELRAEWAAQNPFPQVEAQFAAMSATLDELWRAETDAVKTLQRSLT